ncbi:MAG: hypothetical protein MRY78_16910 [Saprospiraceae bacterium]|nr:hypothetical protein [Saprospiraceae bacterium]
MIRIFPVLLIACLAFAAKAQEVIQLKNPSFEGIARHSQTPNGWLDCGPKGESPPDICPCTAFQVFHDSHEGETYLGMVVRDNNTWETIAQKLEKPLQKGKTYRMNLMLARASEYISWGRTSQKQANYNTPATFRVYGGNKACELKELLFKTDPIDHEDWKSYELLLQPSNTYKYIVFEVYYTDGAFEQYNGNIIIDACSAIEEIQN